MLCLCLASHYAFKPTRYLQDKHYKLLCRILLKIQFVSKCPLQQRCCTCIGCVTTGCSSIPATPITRPSSGATFRRIVSTRFSLPHNEGHYTAYDGFSSIKKSQPSQVSMTNSGQQIRCLRLSVVLLLLALKGYTHPAGKLKTPVSKR